MEAKDQDEFILPLGTQVAVLECKSAFEALTNNEKLYAHYLSRASWNGGLIVLLQTSPESPLIFSLLLKIFSGQSIASLVENSGLPADDCKGLLIYTSGIFSNMGNYKSFGDSKFIPSLSVEAFEKVIKSSVAFKNDPEGIEDLWNACKDDIYCLDTSVRSLGFPDTGITTYWSRNASGRDSEFVNKFFKAKNMEGYNCRTFKTTCCGETSYEIRLASVEEGFDASFMPEPCEFQGSCFKVTRGDYSPLMALVVEDLKKAITYAANDTEKQMLEKYVQSFSTGNLNEHKNGSRYWIRDKGPIIETYIGFIESYRDPGGVRGEFEGFVAMVNKKMSLKFKNLVSAATTLIKKLPWDSQFEKDEFFQPDFTSLDVLTFGGSGIPAGINIPNYDEIRQEEGYKNVALGNVIPVNCKADDLFFLSSQDKSLMISYSVKAFEIQVGLHELLGHGSGKLFKKNADSGFNFDPEKTMDPFTGSKVTYYDAGETYDSCFGDLGSSYEECRAECVGLYLSTDEEVLRIFGYEGEEASHVTYVNWLNLLWAGTGRALEMYSPTSKTWLQAHSQARYVITRVLIEAGEGLFTVEETIPGEELLCKLDRSKIMTVGKAALGKFLHKLQVYKSTRNEAAARELYSKYSEVPESGPYPWAQWRKIAIAHKRPRKMFVQANTVIESDEVKLLDYPATPEGLIQSWVDRFRGNTEIHQYLRALHAKDIQHFKS